MDPSEAWGGVVAALALVALNGFFVAAEFSMVKVRATQLAGITGSRAGLAAHMVAHLDSYLAACQVGITLASLGLGWIGEPAIARIIEPPLVSLLGGLGSGIAHGTAFALAFTFISFMHIVLGELAPKSLAIQRALPTTLWIAWPLHLFFKVMYPFIVVLNAAGNAVVSLAGLRPATEADTAHSPEELELIVDGAQVSGALDPEQHELVRNALAFGSRLVRQVMTPRTEMTAIEAGTTFDALVTFSRTTRFARIPVHRGGHDNMVGVLHLRDLVGRSDTTGLTAADLMRPVALLPETMTLAAALQAFRREHTEVGIVIDEFGGTAGLITAGDITAEILGELASDADTVTEVVHDSDGVTVEGLTPLDTLRQELGLRLEQDRYDTVGGLILGRLGRVAALGDRIEIEDRLFEVLALDGRRVSRVRVRSLEKKNR